MSQKPKFSILLPAKGRPDLVRDALISILEQDFDDYEVIVSNNGADPNVKAEIEDLCASSKVIYVEFKDVLPMPEHWEKISLLASGSYLTVLTDRSVLKQNALKTLSDIHEKGGDDAKVVSWCWDLYYSELNLLMPLRGLTSEVMVLESTETIINSISVNAGKYPTALPRGLNSSVSMDIVKKLREKAESAFTTINPDFSFAYHCLMEQKRHTYINSALMISQGLKVSNGGNAYLTDSSKYVATLGLKNPISYSPIKALFVENVIAEDFFSACHLYNRQDILQKYDASNLYLKCWYELHEKKAAKILDNDRLYHLENAIVDALKKESPEIQAKVTEVMNSNSALSTSLTLKRALKRLIGAKLEILRPILLRVRGAKSTKSILHASGHIIQ
jgi:hypothetical protein